MFTSNCFAKEISASEINALSLYILSVYQVLIFAVKSLTALWASFSGLRPVTKMNFLYAYKYTVPHLPRLLLFVFALMNQYPYAIFYVLWFVYDCIHKISSSSQINICYTSLYTSPHCKYTVQWIVY